jgi:hypothetical protein
MYAYFWSCDCIFIETKVSGGEIPSNIWQLASERIFCQVYRCLGVMGSLEYLVVGNNVDGYHGVKGYSTHVGTGLPVKITWSYEVLSSTDCRKLVAERWK